MKVKWKFQLTSILDHGNCCYNGLKLKKCEIFQWFNEWVSVIESLKNFFQVSCFIHGKNNILTKEKRKEGNLKMEFINCKGWRNVWKLNTGKIQIEGTFGDNINFAGSELLHDVTSKKQRKSLALINNINCVSSTKNNE
jgi:hypothetical protein